MKIVHLSTYDTGGAATAALRLHEGLLQQGIDSFFLSLYKKNDRLPNKVQFKQTPFKHTLFQKVKNRLGFHEGLQNQKNRNILSALNGQYENFSFPETDYRVEEHALVKEADIVHLHWVADYINYPEFFLNMRQPLVWTLHDMNPFSGGFHYNGDEERNRKTFYEADKSVRATKARAFIQYNRFHIVTPSKWLGEAAEARHVFTNPSFYHIKYGLDLDVFKIHDKEFAKHVFSLPPDKKIILFVSESVANYRKGFDLVCDALETLDDLNEYMLVAVGRHSAGLSQKSFVHNVGTICDERLMSLLYSAADLFVLPSREDNFPNVMLEAFACGTPVLSFKTGGMAEEILPGINGFFADAISAQALAKALQDFISGKYVFDRCVIRTHAKTKYALEAQATQYISLYKEILHQQ